MTTKMIKAGLIWATALLAFFSENAPAQIALSGDVQTNTLTASLPYYYYGKDISCNASGQYSITWPQQPASSLIKVYSRSYSSTGTANTASQVVANNAPPAAGGGDSDPAISMGINGDYILVYAENNNTIVTSSNFCSIFYQRYNANGTANGARVFVDYGVFPDIDIASDGTFNITYISGHYYFTPQRVYVKRYLASGAAVGARITVQDTPANQGFYNPVIHSLAGNAFYISYQDGNFGSPKMEFFNTAGSNIYGTFYTTGNNTRQLFAVKPNGDVVAVGIDVSIISSSPYTEQVRTKINTYTPSTGSTAAPVYLSPITTTDTQIKLNRASIGINNAGTYVVAFPKYSGSTYMGIYIQQYSVLGTPVGPEYPVSSTNNTMKMVTLDVSDCEFVVSWFENNNVFHKRFGLYDNTTATILHSVQYCSGSPVTVSANVSGNVNGYNWEITQCDVNGAPIAGGYNWTGTTTSGTPGPFTFPSSSNLPCNQYYNIKLNIDNGCRGIGTNVIVYYRCSPTPVITSSEANPLCFGESTTLSVNYTPSTTTFVNWSTGATTQSISVNPPANQTYTVSVTAKGCTATATYTVTRNNNNNPGFTLSATATSGNPYFTATATPIILNPQSYGVNYYWDVVEIDPATGNEIPNTKVYNPQCWWNYAGTNSFNHYTYLTSYTLANNGYSNAANFGCSATTGRFESGHTYRVTRGTWSATCPWTVEAQLMMMCPTCRTTGTPELVVTNLGVFDATNLPENLNYLRSVLDNGAQNADQPSVSIAPNPSLGLFSLTNLSGAETQVEVYNLSGQLILSSQTTDLALQLDLTAQPAGLYLCRITANGHTQTRRLVIE
jgi:hypothetical protein